MKSMNPLRAILIVLITLCAIWTTQGFLSITATTAKRGHPNVIDTAQGTVLLHGSEDDTTTTTNEENPAPATEVPKPVKCPDCDLCDGSGRILGGIAVLLPWWPIKA
jgi:hypothetical protein